MNAWRVEFKRFQDTFSSINETFYQDTHDLAQLIDINKKLACKNGELQSYIANLSFRIDILFELLADDSQNDRSKCAIKLLDKTTKLKIM